MNIQMRNYKSKLSILALGLFSALGAQAVDITTVLNSGDPLTAAHMTEIREAVNSKQNQITGTCTANQVIQGVNTDGTVICGDVTGILIDSFVANTMDSLDRITGYYDVKTNYVPSVDARIHIFARCTLDTSSTTGVSYRFRVAYRTPTATGDPVEGESWRLQTDLATANTSVMQVNNDYFDLSAGQSYDFGVHFSEITPPTGTRLDYCTLTAMVFSR